MRATIRILIMLLIFAFAFAASAQEAASVLVDPYADASFEPQAVGLATFNAGDPVVVYETEVNILLSSVGEYMGAPEPGVECSDFHTGTGCLSPVVQVAFPDSLHERHWDTLQIVMGANNDLYVVPFAYNPLYFANHLSDPDTARLSANQYPHPVSGAYRLNMTLRDLLNTILYPVPAGKEYLHCLRGDAGWYADESTGYWCVES